MSAATVIDQSAAMTAQNTLRIDPTLVHVDKSFNSRTKEDKRKREALKEDIRRDGVQSPVKLYISDGSEGQPEVGTPVVVFGFTRTEVCKELFQESNGDPKYLLPYTLVDHVPSKLEALTLNATENFQRSDLTTWDTVMLIKRFEEEHGVKSAKEIAEKFGKSPAWVTQHRKLFSSLHPEIQKRLNLHPDDKGYIPGSVAMELVNLEDQNEQLEALKNAEMDGSGVVTRDNVKTAVAKQAETGNQTVVKARTIKQVHNFLEGIYTPPAQAEDEDDEAFKERKAAYQADPLVPFAKKFRSFLDGKTKEVAFTNYLRKVVVATEKGS